MIRKLLARMREPVVTDRSVDLLAVFLWACYSGWGVSTTISGLPTVGMVTTPAYELVWGAAIGVLAAAAVVGAALTFLPHADSGVRIQRKRLELVSVSLLGGFVSVYPIFVVGSAFLGDADRISTVFIAVSYLGFPTWRVFSLSRRIAALQKAQAGTELA